MKLKKRRIIIWGMVFIYVLAGVIVAHLMRTGTLTIEQPIVENSSKPLVTNSNLDAAQIYFADEFVRNDGFVRLYAVPGNATFPGENQTNSEAISYYLYASARAKDKRTFDWTLDFIEMHMIHPQGHYIMWRLEDNLTVNTDGVNIASDADLRAIKALLLAEQQWGDERYTKLIDQLATALETVAITNDNYLAPYGGMSGNTSWTANEVWLSYADFTVFEELAKRRDEPWTSVLANTKQAYLNAQIRVGFYNPSLNEKREFGNGIDGGGYSINSLWMTVRAAQSNDPQLMAAANKTVSFYARRFGTDAELFALYNGNGDPLSAYDTPWVYALVARAAIALDDQEIADSMIEKLLEKQIQNPRHQLYGAIPESIDPVRVGQFTMQESILALQEYAQMQKQDITLSPDTIDAFWQDRQPVSARPEPIETTPPIEPEVEPVIETPPTLTKQFLESYKENVAYYSFIYKDPKYIETFYFVHGDLVKIISEERFFIIDTQTRKVSPSQLVRVTDRLLQDIRDGTDATIDYIWYNQSSGDAHGCYVQQAGSYKLDPSYREIKENCITYSNKPFQAIHRFIHFTDRPLLPHQWLEEYVNQEPVSVESGVIFRDIEQEAQHTAYVLTYENKDSTKTRMTIQAQYKLPLRVEIYNENRTLATYEYDYFRANDRQVSVWNENFLTI